MTGNITYVKQKSGVVYAYENLGTWDKVNKKPICRRRLLGKVDPVTKEIVPTDHRNRRYSPDYKPEPYEVGYKMPTSGKERGAEILRLLKENYELKQKVIELEEKVTKLKGQPSASAPETTSESAASSAVSSSSVSSISSASADCKSARYLIL